MAYSRESTSYSATSYQLAIPELFENCFKRLDDFLAWDIAFAELQFEIERFVLGPVIEDVRLRPPGFRLREILADLRARGAP